MNTKPRSVLSTCISTFLVATAAHAAVYTWDSNTGTVGAQDGAGTWNTSGTNWLSGGSNVVFGNTSSDTAIFGAASGTAGTITVSAVTANALTFNAAGSGNYTLSSGTITLAGTSPTLTANVNATIGSVLAGTAGLTSTGAGVLTLTGSNIFSGTTTVSAGTLTLNGAAGQLAITTGLTVTGSATFNLGDAGAANGLANRINTAATLTLGGTTGAGTFSVVEGSTLANSQSFASLTIGVGGVNTINTSGSTGGTPTVTFSAANPYLRSSAGGVVNLTTANLTTSFTSAPSGTGNVAGTSAPILVGAVLNGNDFVADAAGAVTAPAYAATWGSDATLNVTGSNVNATTNAVNAIRFSDSTARTLTLQSTGTTVVASGMILVTGTAVLGTGQATGNQAITSGTLTSGNGSDLIVYANQTGADKRIGKTTALNITSNISNNGATPIALNLSGPGANVYLNNTNANTYSGGTYLNGVNAFVNADNSLGAIPGSAQNNIFATGASGINFINNFTLNANRNIFLGNGANFALQSNGFNTVAGQISGGGTNAILTINISGGAGSTSVVALSGTNNGFTGTYVLSGELRATEGVGLSSNATLEFVNAVWNQSTLETSGTFVRSVGTGPGQVYWQANATYGSGGFTAYGGPLTVSLGGTASPSSLKWGVGNFISGLGGTLQIHLQDPNATANLTWINPIDFNTRQCFISAGSTTYPATMAGVLSNGGLTKWGTGTLILSATNTYNGQTQIQQGALSVSSLNHIAAGSLGGSNSPAAGSGLGAPTTVANGLIPLGSANTSGTLIYTGPGETTDRTIQVGANSIPPAATDTGGATIENDGGGALIFTAANFNTATNATSGTGANRAFTLQGSNTGANTISGIVQDNTKSGTATGTTTVALAKAGVGTWTLGGANTYTGATTISSGVLEFSGTASMPSVGAVTVNSGGTLAVAIGGAGQFTTGTSGAGTIGGLVGGTGGQGAGVTWNSGATLGVDTATASGTYAGIIANSGTNVLGLAKLGTNTLTLTGSNTYTGATTIGAGTLQIGDGTTDGSIATSGTIANNAALVYNLAGSQSAGSIVSGSGSLTKTGGGALTLANANTFTGDTVIAGGTLVIGGATSLQNSTLNYNNQGGALSFGSGIAATLGGLKGAQNLSLLNTGSTGVALSVGNNNASTTYTGVITGTNSAASLTKVGTGTLTLDPGAATSGTIYSVAVTTGTLALNSGALTVPNTGAGGFKVGSASVPAFNLNGGTLVTNGGPSMIGGDAAGGKGIFTLTSGTWKQSANFISIGYGSTGNGSVINVNGGLLSALQIQLGQNAGTQTLNLNGGVVQVNNLFNSGATGILNFNGGVLRASAAGNIVSFTGTANVLTGGATIDTNGYNVTVVIALVSGTAGDGGLTKNGAGTLTLSGLNSYAGATKVNVGTLGVDFTALASGSGNQSNHIGSSSALQLGGGTLLVTGVASSTTLASTAWTAQAGAGTNLYTLTFGSAPAGLVVGQPVTATGLAGAYVVSQNTGSKTVTVYSSTVPGATGSDFAAASSTPLSTQTFAGTTLNAGASAVTVNASTGGGTVVNLGAITRNVGTAVNFINPSGTLSTTNGILTSSGAASAILTSNGAAYATVGGSDWAAKDATNAWVVGLSTLGGYTNSTTTALSGNADVSSATDTTLSGDTSISSLRFNQAEARTITLNAGVNLTTGGILNTGTVGGNSSLITGGTLSGAAGKDLVVINNAASSTFTIASAIADNTSATGLSKFGAGALTLSGSNTYTGTTTLASGTVQANSSSALGTGGNIAFGGGVLQYTSLSSGQDWSPRFKGSSSAIVLDTNGQSVTLAGAIDNSNTGGLTTAGAGTLTLSGSNTYAGVTSVNAGTLAASSAAALPGYGTSGQVTFNGGTIGVQVGGSGWTTPQVDTLLSNATKTSGALGIDTTNGDLTQWTPFTTANFGSTLGLTKLGNGTLVLSQSNSYTGPTTVTGGTLQIGDGTNGSLAASSTITINSGGALAVNLANSGTFASALSMYVYQNPGATVNAMGSGTNTISGNIAGTVYTTFNQSGTGTTILSGNNTYYGPTNINAGILQLGYQYAAYYSTINVGVNNGLAFGVTPVTIGGLSGTSGFALLTTSGTGAALTIGNNNQNSSYTGSILGTGSTATLTKTGTGTFTYAPVTSSTISYVNVNQGKLLVTGGTLRITNTWGLNVNGNGAVFEQTGGLVNSAFYSTIGASTGATLNVLGGTFNNTGEILMGYSAGAPGTVNVSGSGIITGYFLRLGTFAGATANLSTGGTIQVARIFTDGTAGIGTTLNMDGGTIRATASSYGTTFIQGLDNAYIKTGGITFDTAGNNATIAQPLQTGTGLAGNDGGLTKIGAGTLTLSGSNTYNGGTTVSSGTLQLGSANALGAATGNLTVNGGTLDLNGNSAMVGALSGGTGAVITTSSNASVTLTVSGSTSGTFAGIIQNGSGKVGLTQAGTSNLTLAGANTYSGDTVIAGGTLVIGGSTALQNSTLNYDNQGGALSFGTQTVVTLGGLKGAQYLALLNTSGSGVALTVGGNNQDTTYTGLITGTNSASFTKYGVGTLTLDPGAATTTRLGFVTANAGNLILKSGTFTNTGTDPSVFGYLAGFGARGGTLTIDGATVNVATGTDLKPGAAANGNIAILSGTVNVAWDFVLGHNGSVVGTQSGGSVTAATMYHYDGGTASYTLTGGTLATKRIYNRTAGTDAFTLNLNGGTLQAAAGTTNLIDNWGGGGAEVAVLLGAGNTVIDTTSSSATIVRPMGDMSGQAGAFTKAGANTLTLTASNSYSGGTTVNAGTLQVGNGGVTGSLSPSGAITDNGSLAFNRSNTLTQGTDFAATISGSGSLVQTGSGTTILSGSNSYSGGTTVNAGTLQVGNANALGTGGLAVNGGTLDLAGNSIGVPSFRGTGASAQVTNSVSGTSTLTTAVSGTSAYAGNIVNGTGSVVLTNSGAGTLILSGSLSMTGLNASSGVTQLTQSGSIGAVNVATGATLSMAAHSGSNYNVLNVSSLTISGFSSSLAAANNTATDSTAYMPVSAPTQQNAGVLTAAGHALAQAAATSDAVPASPEAVPEPGTWGMLLSGLGLLLSGRRRKVNVTQASRL